MGSKFGKLLRAVLVLAAAGAQPAAAGSLPSRTQAWIQLDSASAVLVSNAGEAKTAEIAGRLEQFRAVLHQRVLGVEPTGAVPLVVYVFRNETSLNPYKPEFARAYFHETDFEKHLVLNATPSAVTTMNKNVQHRNAYAYFPFHDVYHEYTHFALSTAVPGAPSWLHEGLAQFLGTFRVRKGTIEIGQAAVMFSAPLQSKWIPFGELMTARTPHGKFPDVPLFYAESWALVHYLLLNPAANGRLNTYIDALRGGATYERAFAETFDVSPAQLQAAVHEHITAQRLPYLTFPAATLEVPTAQRVRPLTHPEVLCRLAELLVPMPELAAESERHFRAALEEAPEYGPAWNGLARLLEAAGQIEGAAEYHRKAVALDPGNYRLQIDYGRNCLALLERTGASDLREDARRAFSAAVKLRPELGEPYVAFGSLYLYEEQYVAGGEPALRKAWNMLPWRMDVPLALMLLGFKRGDAAAAGEVAELALTLGPTEFLGLLAADVARIALSEDATPPSYAAQVEQACVLVAELRADPKHAALWAKIEADSDARAATEVLVELGLALRQAAPLEGGGPPQPPPP